MDQKRLFLAIAISVAILLGFQMLLPAPKPVAPPAPLAGAPAASGTPTPSPSSGAEPSTALSAGAVPKEVPRVKIAGPRVDGSISLLGARIDELVLKGYREAAKPDAPLVKLLEPRSEKQLPLQ